ncbi:DMT family transporter [Jatrophihabitans fulvus]
MRADRTDAALAGVLVVCWSSGFVGAAVGTREAPVVTVLVWRTVVSAAVLVAWVAYRRERVSVRGLVQQAVLGLLVQVLYLGGVFAAAGVGVAAGTSALITCAQPLLVAAVAGRAFGEPVTRRQMVGLGVGVVGVLVVVSGDLGAGGAPPWAFLLPVAALLALTAGTVSERRWRPGVSLPMSLAVQSTTAAVVFVAVAAARGEFAPPASTGFWAATGWLVVLASFGGYGAYFAVVRRSGPSRASTLLYLTPAVTTLWAFAVLGQQPSWFALPGGLLCGAGVALALRGQPSRSVVAPRPTTRTTSPNRLELPAAARYAP